VRRRGVVPLIAAALPQLGAEGPPGRSLRRLAWSLAWIRSRRAARHPPLPRPCCADDVCSVSPPGSNRLPHHVGSLSPAGSMAAAAAALGAMEARLSNLRFARADSSSSSVADNESLGFTDREVLAAIA
jgi:hypothetical protein